MTHPLHEVDEEILKRLDVPDLIRCKSVCKSWSSLISDPIFIKAHLNYRYVEDHNNERFGDRRITMFTRADYLTLRIYNTDHNFFYLNDYHLLGSSNGLVCVSRTPNDILVMNPSTREFKKLIKPQIPDTSSLCWGFGYDSTKDDYKLVLGFKRGDNQTCFQVFSLRYEIWNVIGEITYVFDNSVGILCNGALHWFAYDTLSGNKKVILSFQFSDEKFVEVPKPDDARCQLYAGQWPPMRLGTMEECLCIFRHKSFAQEVWVMKDYNKVQSWEMFGREREIKREIVHGIKLLKNYVPNKRSLPVWFCANKVFFGTPLFVESLVSPHFHKIPPSKRRVVFPIKSPKVKAKRRACEEAGTSSGPRV